MLQASNAKWSTQESNHCGRKEKKPSLPDYHYLYWQILCPSVAALLSSHVSNGFPFLPYHTFTFLTFYCVEVILTSSHSSSHSSSTPKCLQSFIDPFLVMGRNILIGDGLSRMFLFVKKLESPSSNDILAKPGQDQMQIVVAPSASYQLWHPRAELELQDCSHSLLCNGCSSVPVLLTGWQTSPSAHRDLLGCSGHHQREQPAAAFTVKTRKTKLLWK